MQNKKSQRNIQYCNIHYTDTDILKIYLLGILERQKFQTVLFLPIMAEAAIRQFHYYCIFGPFNKNPRALKKFEKFSSQQLLLQELLLLHLLLKFRM